MAKYSQANRTLSVATPLGTDVLLLQQFRGEEAVSRLFQFELDLLAESTATVAFDSILGQSVDRDAGDAGRQLALFQRDREPIQPGPPRRRRPWAARRFTCYRAEVVPELWLLTKKAQSRIFQQLTVPEILKQVLAGLDVSYQLSGTYNSRDYCVQYRETDFNFASRLMEEEGIYYYFKHRPTAHQHDRRRHAARPARTCPIPARSSTTAIDRRHPRRGPDPRLGEDAGAALGQIYAVGSLLRAAAQAPRGSAEHPDQRRRSARSATSSTSTTTTSSSSTTTPASTPSASTASTPAAATDRPTCSTSSRTTRAPSASACRRRRRPGWSSTGRATAGTS